VYLRVGSPPIPVLHESREHCPLQVGRGILMMDGTEVTLISAGAALPRAVAAAEMLHAEGVGVRLISMPCIKPLDRELVCRAARETGRIVSVEEHYVAGGLGGAVAELLAVECPTPMRMIGVRDRYPPSGPYEDVLRDNGLQPDQIAAAVREFLA
jgi:transketolase